jgi:CPA2 family monovalent cation:H+ antiporter-2
MSHLPSLIYDLALILIAAGAITLLFKWLKQPLVLGYIVAGILAGPHVNILPINVIDTVNIQTWADLGVIILLFALGLDFSFKKLLSVGKTAFLTAMTIVFGMMSAGLLIGNMLGWSLLNSLFLGGMLCMSSTTIIIKAFDDMKLREAPHAKLVFGVLVVEDLVAVILMVLLSTISVSKAFDGGKLIAIVTRLFFFLSLWFVFGVFLIPTFLRRVKKLMSDETLLIVTGGMCLGMVVLAVKSGFSAALGAFIMGSILSETNDVKRIEKLMDPLKNFFGAIFFVSVGMMVQPEIIGHHITIVLILVATVVVGQLLFSTMGFLLSGQSLETSLRSGFSLGQIGEFAFIIASLGLTLGVLEPQIYPIVIAVSVITIFTTPYIMNMAGPVNAWLLRVMPKKWLLQLNRPPRVTERSSSEQAWFTVLRSYLTYLFVLLFLVTAILYLILQYVNPFLAASMHQPLASIVSFSLSVLLLSPFLRALLSNNVESAAFMNLWMEKTTNRRVLMVLVGIRVVAVFAVLIFVINHFFDIPWFINLILTLLLLFSIMKSKRLLRHFWNLESRFLINLNERHMDEHFKQIEAAGGVMQLNDMHKNHWLDYKLFTCAFRLRKDSPFIGKRVKELNIRLNYNLMVIRVRTSEEAIINIPAGDYVLKQGDSIRLAGKKSKLRKLQEDEQFTLEFVDHSYMTLHGFSKLEFSRKKKGDRITCAGIPLSDDSPLAGKDLIESNIGARTKCLVIGLEREGKQLVNPEASTTLLPGDIIWMLGEEKSITRHIEENVYFL